MLSLALPFMRASRFDRQSARILERAVYKDQLAELDRDEARGMIAVEEATAARNEISRRLLTTGNVPEAASASARGPRAGIFAVFIIPAVALPVYFAQGNPGMPDVPLAERLANAVRDKDAPAMIAQIERHLEKQPDDVNGWQTLIPAYQSAKRWADAANAYANIIRIVPPDARLLTEHAEMLMMANNGDLPPEGHEALRKALELDPKNPKTRFFEALALKQVGRRGEALARMTALLADAPADAAYRQAVELEIKDLAAVKVPALTDEQIAAGSAMSKEDQATMIAGMINQLEQRLGTTSTDVEGWKRLIRARVVNAEPDKAAAAIKLAKTIFKDQPPVLDELSALAREMGIQQ